MLVSRMKNTLENTGATRKTGTDYFEIILTSEPSESYGIEEFKKRIEAMRKKKAQKQKTRTPK